MAELRGKVHGYFNIFQSEVDSQLTPETFFLKCSWLEVPKTIHVCRIALIYLFCSDCVRFDGPLPYGGCFLLAMLWMSDVAAWGDFAVEIKEFGPPSIPPVL